MNDLPAAKIKMMKGSIRCLIFGVLALLPAIGLPFGLAALWISGRVRKQEKMFWNPARPYRIWGVACAAGGTVVWFLVVTLIVYHSVSSSSYGGIYRLSGDE
jgi:hypothetical protein